MTIGTELAQASYRTVFVGKYLNGLRGSIPRRRVARYAQGWHDFDVIYAENGRYRDYDLWTREGMRHYGRRGHDHSTLVAKRRVVKHLRAARRENPVLAFVSLVDLHAPNRPATRFAGDRRCRTIPRWKPPSYDADVSDKPAYVRDRQRRGPSGWSMQRYCEQMLGVDELVGAVVRTQRRRGRLADALFVFTADNGVTWGTQRLPWRKGVPYAPPIPKGPPTADGVDLLPLLDGEVDHLDRLVIREQSGHLYDAAPQFWAIRTTSQHPMGALALHRVRDGRDRALRLGQRPLGAREPGS